MTDVHEGGCLCGAVRYRTTGAPRLAQACHCTYCQRRTGSAFAPLVAFLENQVEISGGPLTEFEHRSDESDRWVRYHFCSRCGTTVYLTLEMASGARIIAGGTYDDPRWFTLTQHIWTRSAQHWMLFPPEVKRFEKGFTR